MTQDYLESVKKQFTYYKSLGEKTFAQLSDEQLFWRYNEDSNSVATLVKHIAGNMRSRWTNFLTTDGEKDFRNREGEFENDIPNREDLLKRWNEGWDCLFTALDSVNETNFDQLVYIRNQGHTITEAINRQLAHYPYHIGQIVYLGKMLTDGEWASLSIPRGGSKAFNEAKFAQPKHRQHFTDEFLKPDSETAS